MLESRKTSHLTLYAARVKSKMLCNTNTSLAYDSEIEAFEKGERIVRFCSKDGPLQVNLPETVVLSDTSISLLSVPALLNKEICVLLILK